MNNIAFVDAEVKVEEVKQLLLHQVDFGQAENARVFGLLTRGRKAMVSRLLKTTHGRSKLRHTQCLFLGEQSLTYLAAQIKVAKKTRCLVQAIPLATLGNLPLNRSNKATAVTSVGI
jgi:hypothetical protein